MTRQTMTLRRKIDCWVCALCVALAIGLAAVPAVAVEPPAGSTNFTPPRSAPDYFSNESGSFRGGATARAAPSEAAPGIVMPASHRRVAVAVPRHDRQHSRHIGRARGRFRLAHLHSTGHRHVADSHAGRIGKKSARGFAHAHPGHVASKAVAARARHRPAPSKVRRVARLHG